VTNDCTIVTVNKCHFVPPEDFEGSRQQGHGCRDDFPEHKRRGVLPGAVFPGKLPMHTMMFHRELSNFLGFCVLQLNCGTIAGLSKFRMHLFTSTGGWVVNSAFIDQKAAPGAQTRCRLSSRDNFSGVRMGSNRSQQGQFCGMSLGAGLLLKAALTAFRM